MLRSFVFILLCSFAGMVQADGTMRHLRKMEGYTIIAVTSVDGEFQGCDFGRVIKLQNGMSYKCSFYSYTYAYSPDAVVFAKANAYQGKSLATIKLLIEGEVFDMEPVLLK